MQSCRGDFEWQGGKLLRLLLDLVQEFGTRSLQVVHTSKAAEVHLAAEFSSYTFSLIKKLYRLTFLHYIFLIIIALR
jgi:hypothetical protein